MGGLFGFLIIGSAALPCLLLVRWINRFDLGKPEPRFLIVKLFVLGLITPLIAGVIEMVTVPLCTVLPAGLVVPAQAFIGIALVEEAVKLGAMVVVVRRRREFDEVLDGAVYGITTAMGFALVENIMYVVGADMPMGVALIRGITAVPLHALAGGFMGLAWARFKIENKGSVGGALLVAIIIHGAYDWALMDSRVSGALIWPILIIGWAILVASLRRARKDDRKAGRNA